MKIPSLLAILTALYLLGGGCVHTVEPLTTNFDKTPSGIKTAANDTRRIQYNGLSIDWHTSGIGHTGKKHGFNEVYYADLETLSILGIWTQKWVHIYGR